jgi:hypothetical protein
MNKEIKNGLKVLLVAVIFSSCEPIDNSQHGKVEAKNVNDYEVTNEGVQILTIDSCQYVWCKNGYGAGITHKGNCKYCAVRAKNNCH